MSHWTLLIAVTTDVAAEVDQVVADDKVLALEEVDAVEEAEDAKLTPAERQEARKAARIAEREARKAERILARQREQAGRQEQRLLSRRFEMAGFWGEATFGDPALTWRAYPIILRHDEVRPTIRFLRQKWEDARVIPLLCYDSRGNFWEERDPETGEVTDTINPRMQIWRFMGPVQDGVDANDEPIYRARRRRDPWVLPNVVAGDDVRAIQTKLEALRDA